MWNIKQIKQINNKFRYTWGNHTREGIAYTMINTLKLSIVCTCIINIYSYIYIYFYTYYILYQRQSPEGLTLYTVNTPKGESSWFDNTSISWNTMNLLSTPSKWSCLVQWKYFNPKLPNSWHSSVPESPVWIIHWNLTLLNDSFPTKSLIQHSRRPSPSFSLKDPPWWLTLYDPRLQWCHSQRSQGEKLQNEKVEWEKLLGINEFWKGNVALL